MGRLGAGPVGLCMPVAPAAWWHQPPLDLRSHHTPAALLFRHPQADIMLKAQAALTLVMLPTINGWPGMHAHSCTCMTPTLHCKKKMLWHSTAQRQSPPCLLGTQNHRWSFTSRPCLTSTRSRVMSYTFRSSLMMRSPCTQQQQQQQPWGHKQHNRSDPSSSPLFPHVALEQARSGCPSLCPTWG